MPAERAVESGEHSGEVGHSWKLTDFKVVQGVGNDRGDPKQGGERRCVDFAERRGQVGVGSTLIVVDAFQFDR